MSITLKEIRDAACGVDKDGHSKSLSILGAHIYNLADPTKEPKVIAEFSSKEPVISIHVSGEITWIDFKFHSDQSHDLSLYFRTLERFLEETDNNTESENAAAFATVMPIELKGRYYINAVNPVMWAMEPEAVGEVSRILRIAFFSDNVSFLESDLDDNFIEQALTESEDVNNHAAKEYFAALDGDDYGESDRDEDFISEDRFFEEEYGYSDEDDESEEDTDDDDDNPTDRSTYVYH